MNQLSRSEYKLVHPKISNSTAAAVGISPSSYFLMGKSLELLSDGERWEAFGQTESLTTRIASILNEYQEGASIIFEWIQNADDAWYITSILLLALSLDEKLLNILMLFSANTVKIVYDKTAYPCDSLLNPKMKEFQGPAVIVYNDAVFSKKDFSAICSLGKPSKKDAISKIGRFGVGFNACYHITDLPSFVSGQCISDALGCLSSKDFVFFDPHAANLPHATKSNPGVRFNYIKSNITTQFPDQVSEPQH